jgi:hypothetical protein
MAEMHDRLPPIIYNPGGYNKPSWLVTKYDDTFVVL